MVANFFLRGTSRCLFPWEPKFTWTHWSLSDSFRGEVGVEKEGMRFDGLWDLGEQHRQRLGSSKCSFVWLEPKQWGTGRRWGRETRPGQDGESPVSPARGMDLIKRPEKCSKGFPTGRLGADFEKAHSGHGALAFVLPYAMQSMMFLWAPQPGRPFPLFSGPVSQLSADFKSPLSQAIDPRTKLGPQSKSVSFPLIWPELRLVGLVREKQLESNLGAIQSLGGHVSI